MNDDELTHIAQTTQRDQSLLLETAGKIHNISLLLIPVLAFLGFVASVELVESGASSTVIACVVAPLLHKYVKPDPPFAVNVVLAPTQIVVALAVIDAVGNGLTVTTTWSVFTHPFAFVPVTVYVVVALGLAVTLAVFVALKPVDGLHTYVAAPLATKLVDEPAQIAASFPALTTGNGFTPIVVTALVAEHPFAFVTVTL